MGLLLGVAAIMVHAAVSPIAGFYKEMTISQDVNGSKRVEIMLERGYTDGTNNYTKIVSADIAWNDIKNDTTTINGETVTFAECAGAMKTIIENEIGTDL